MNTAANKTRFMETFAACVAEVAEAAVASGRFSNIFDAMEWAPGHIIQQAATRDPETFAFIAASVAA